MEISKEELGSNWSFTVLPDGTIKLNKYLAGGEVPCLVVPCYAGGKKVTEIGAEAFARGSYDDAKAKRDGGGVRGIKKIIFPGGLVSVGRAAFSGCAELESAVFREGLREIMGDAFSNCPKLKTVTLPKSLRHMEGRCFSPNSKITIYAPKGSYAETYAAEHSNCVFEESPPEAPVPAESIETARNRKPTAKEYVLLLEAAVLDGTEEELGQVIEKHAPFEFTARALGFALRYGGEQKARILADLGASFEYGKEDKKLKTNYHTSVRDGKFWNSVRYDLFPVFDTLFSHPRFFGTVYNRYEGLERLAPGYYVQERYRSYYYYHPHEEIYYGKERAPLPEAERAAAIRAYYAHCAKKGQKKTWAKSSAFFYALAFGFFSIADALTDSGQGPGEVLFGRANAADIYFFAEAYSDHKGYDVHMFEATLKKTAIKHALDEQVLRHHLGSSGLWKPEYAELLAVLLCFGKLEFKKPGEDTGNKGGKPQENFEVLPISRTKANEFVRFAIECDSVYAMGKICGNGLITDKNVNRFIEEASAGNKTQVLALLMDWKNKNVDLAVEQRRTEVNLKRRMYRKTDPNSYGEMIKIWDVSPSIKEITIDGYKGGDTEIITIPEKIGARTVTAIGYRAFQNCTALKKVTIQSGVTEIRSNAFAGCTALTDIVLPKTLKTIGWDAFSGCTSLEKITLPHKMKSISNDAFANCPKLTICSKKHSYPEKFARNNKIPFEIIEKTENTETENIGEDEE